MNRFYQGDWIDSMASRFIEELPEKHLEKNLKEVKDIFRENYQNHNVMHMVIINKDKNENNFRFAIKD